MSVVPSIATLAPTDRPVGERLVALLVDDNQIDLRLLQRTLEGIVGWSVEPLVCSTYEEARRLAGTDSADVLLVDYQLGRWNGFDLVRELRSRGVRAPAILLTSGLDENLALEALRAGFSDCIPKDQVSVRSLQRSITNCVSRHRLQLELDRYRVELERTVQDLENRNKEIEGFYHTLSHELKTPLTAAIEFVSIVADGHAGELRPEQVRFLRKAEKNCRLLVTYIDDMFDVTRLETGKMSLDREPLVVADLLEEVGQAWRARCAERGLDLRVKDAAQGRCVCADERRLRQILGNLLSNALKFTERGSIEVEARHVAGEMRFSVTDTGRGIPADKLEVVFDRLAQVHRTDATERGGLGLGLSIARELVHLHGGRIAIESEPGVGSTFSFHLPLSDCP